LGPGGVIPEPGIFPGQVFVQIGNTCRIAAVTFPILRFFLKSPEFQFSPVPSPVFQSSKSTHKVDFFIIEYQPISFECDISHLNAFLKNAII
jgi:hypothetical protein